MKISYAMIFSMSSTFSTTACTPVSSTAFFTISNNVLHLLHPVPRIWIFMFIGSQKRLLTEKKWRDVPR